MKSKLMPVNYKSKCHVEPIRFRFASWGQATLEKTDGSHLLCTIGITRECYFLRGFCLYAAIIKEAINITKIAEPLIISHVGTEPFEELSPLAEPHLSRAVNANIIDDVHVSMMFSAIILKVSLKYLYAVSFHIGAPKQRLQNCHLCIIKIYTKKNEKQKCFIYRVNAYNPIMFLLSNYTTDGGIFLKSPYYFAVSCSSLSETG